MLLGSPDSRPCFGKSSPELDHFMELSRLDAATENTAAVRIGEEGPT